MAGSGSLKQAEAKINALHVINCAGLYGDQINQMLTGQSSFEICPRKGQFVVFDKSAGCLTQTILLPVPTEITKGIVVCPTIFGNLLVGPTATQQQSRDTADVDKETLEDLITQGQRILPGLKQHAVTATYAGLRPATEHKDYQIEWHHDLNYCCVGGIRSTGLSASLGIASYVFNGYTDAVIKQPTVKNIIWPKPTAIAESMQRDWQKPDNDGIVCHCERVTRREIKEP